MRRLAIILLSLALALSLAANGLLGYAAYRAQKEYRALAAQFVKVKADLAKAKGPGAQDPGPKPAPSAQAAAAQAQSSPAAAPAAGAQSHVTQAEIQDAYAPRLLAIQAECEGSLDALLAQAKAEYKQARASGSELDLGAFVARFYPRANSLRRGCDRKVEALLGQMEGELRDGHLPLDLVDQVRSAYQERIVERQAEILAKIGQ